MNNLDKIHGCFLGVMIGDAIGAPVEMMKPEDILAQNNGNSITGFNHNVRRKQFKNEEELEVPHGKTTDDWALTNCIRTSLIRRGKFDLTDIALAHVEEYETSTSGWGGTTKDSMKELRSYFNGRGYFGRSPFIAPAVVPNRGSGNGIAMKIAPIALMHLFKKSTNDELMEEVAALGKMTHSDPRAWTAAYALCCVLYQAHNTLVRRITIDQLSSIPSCKDVIQNRNLRDSVLNSVYIFEQMYDRDNKNSFRFHLSMLLDDNLLFGPIEKLREIIGAGCICTESVIFAIACFLRNPFDFRKAVLEATNSGFDSDTNSSMIGMLIGSLVGSEGIPTEWISYSTEFAKAEVHAKEFHNIFV